MSVFDRTAEQYETVAFDRPGLGYSDRPPDGGSPFVQARLIHRALGRLEVERPVLVGHSRGGNVVLAYALTYPDEVAGVVTLAAAPYGGEIGLQNRALVIPVLGPVLAHTLYVPFGRAAVEAGLETAFAPEGPPPPDYVDVYAAYELRPGQLLAHAHDQVRGRAAIAEMARRYDELRTPLVIVHGTADRNVPIEQARWLHRAAPESHLMAIDGAGHELMFTRPDAVMDAIDAVWRTAAQD
jgi:pimeloyl-ACP methyl ester carboxylesterase